MFLYKIWKIFKNTFLKNTSGSQLPVLTREFWEVFPKTFFIEHLQETPYFI